MAAEFVRRHRNKPMLLALWVRAPHEPLEYLDRYRETHRNTPIDPGPAYAEADKSDKPPWVQEREAPSLRAITKMASDNGYLFGEHGLTSKSLPYEESVRIPMFWVGPGVTTGAVRDELVTNNDITPTILELTSAHASRPVDGRSLVPLLEGAEPASWRTAVLSEHPGSEKRPSHRLVRTSDHAFIEWGDGFRELYDMGEDPYQLENLLASERPPDGDVITRLEDRLTALRGCEANTCVEAENGTTS